MSPDRRFHLPLRILYIAMVVFSLFPGRIAAQDGVGVTNSLNIGLPENGVFNGSDFDNVQTNNGNLHVAIPLINLKGRGPEFYVSLVYDGASYYETSICPPKGQCAYTWHLGTPTPWKMAWSLGYSVSSKLVYLTICNTQTWVYVATGVTMREPDGTLHHFAPDPEYQP